MLTRIIFILSCLIVSFESYSASEYTDTFPTRAGWQNGWAGGGVPYGGYLVSGSPMEVAQQYIDVLNNAEIGNFTCSNPNVGPCVLDGFFQKDAETYIFDYKYVTAGRPHGSEGAEDSSLTIIPHYTYSCPDQEFNQYVAAGKEYRTSDDRCYRNVIPNCSCTQNAVDGQCVTREPVVSQEFYNDQDVLLFTISDSNNQGKACYTRKDFSSQNAIPATANKNGYKNGWSGGWITKTLYSQSPEGVANQYVDLLNLRDSFCFIDDRGVCQLNDFQPHASADDYFNFDWIYVKNGNVSPQLTAAPNIEYTCPNPEFSAYFDFRSDGFDRKDLCFKVKVPDCECDENLSGNQCVARTPDYSGNKTGLNPDSGLFELVSDENNQGQVCYTAFKPEKCSTGLDINNPINCSSGTKRQTENDYSASVGGIKFSRTYFSTEIPEQTIKRTYTQANKEFPANYQIKTYLNAEANVSTHEWMIEGLPFLDISNDYQGVKVARFIRSNGTSRVFLKKDTETSWSKITDKDGDLADTELGLVYTTISGTTYQFDSEGRLIEKTYRNGQKHTISYLNNAEATITDSFGRVARFFYDTTQISNQTTKKVVTKFVDPAGNEYLYEHDNKGYITKVIYPDATPTDLTDNPFKAYLYDDRNVTKVLTGVIDENGDQYATYGYDDKNRAISTEHAGGAIKATIDYLDDAATDQSLVRFYRDDVNYREAIYHHKLLNGVDKISKLEQTPCVDCVVGESTYQYDANGYLSQMTAEDGDVTNYQYNNRGLLESITQAVGTPEARTVTTTWHASYNLPLSIDEPTRLTTYAYDANGNMLSRTVQDKETTETRTVAYTYNSVGQVLTLDGPRTDVTDITTYEYDVQGNLTKVTNALGHVTNITAHDAHGKPLSVTDPNGTVTSMTYHPRNWLTSVTTDGDTTTYGYDNAGQLINVTMANGIQLNYEYDAAHRLVAISDAQANRIEYALDNLGGRTRTDIKDPNGVVKSYASQVFNDLGQLKQTLGANNQTNSFDYDAEGKPTQTNDPLNNSSTQQFDALDRLTKAVDPDLGETSFGYDTQDRLTLVTDATGKTTSYVYNAFGEVLSQTSPDTGISSFTYDSAGNLLTSVDARNVNISYSYDVLNRVTVVDYPGTAEDVIFTYDDATANSKGIFNQGIGRLTRINDESGSTEYHYDAKGQLLEETRTINSLVFVTRYQYDAAGLVSRVIYPSAREVDYVRNNLGQITQVTTSLNGVTQTVASDISYLPFGPMQSMTYGNGKVLNQNFDADYRLTKKSVAGVTDLTYGYTARNNINAIIDGSDVGKNQSFAYDKLARLIDASGEYGSQSYTFDGIGNRLTKTQDGNLEVYQYDTTSHQMQTAGSTALTYDAIGNTLTKGDLSFTYNQVGRLATSNKVGMNASYLYNAQGERVSKTVNDVTSLYHYDQAGQLIAQTDETGAVQKEYLYLAGMRLAVFSVEETAVESSVQTVNINHKWKNVPVAGQTPIVFASPATFKGNQAGTVAIRQGQTANTVDVKFKEWDYLDGKHALEEVNLLALEPGLYNTADGSVIEVGTFTLKGTKKWSTINFTQAFAAPPKLLLTPQTQNGGNTYTVRARRVVEGQFQAAIFEQESLNSSGHLEETIGYLAIHNPANQGTAKLGDVSLNYQLGQVAVNGQWQTVADCSIKVQEEQSQDTERGHLKEDIDWLNIDGYLFAQDVSTKGGDTISLRRKNCTAVESVTQQSIGLHYVHTDHLGSPIALTDEASEIQWKGSYDPYGKVTEEINNLSQDQRFPGQLLDQETGIHYNYFRDYDPEIGRYLQSDPIGLNGGLNTYGYVGGNPVNAIDPKGLACLASNNIVTCQAPNGGPVIRFPQPKGWPETISANDNLYHAYNINFNGSTDNATRKCLESMILNNPTPGSAPFPATKEGTDNNATPSLIENYMNNPVKSYLTQDSFGNQVIVNVTQPGHSLWPGYVARVVSVQPDGTGFTMNNYGEGLGAAQSTYNPFSSAVTNSSWLFLNAEAKNACACGTE